jgi:hypothetical protein
MHFLMLFLSLFEGFGLRFLHILEGKAYYVVPLVVPAQGFGLWPRFFFALWGLVFDQSTQSTPFQNPGGVT